MDTWVWIAFIVLVVAVVLVVALLAKLNADRVQSKRLRGDFGEVYDDTVAEAGNRRAAEKDLLARKQRVERLHLKPLSAEDRTQLEREWVAVQGRFIDDPVDAAQSADALIDSVLTRRGYPETKFEQRLDDLSVEHPELIRRYRSARTMFDDRGDEADTEQMRKAVLEYRDVFSELTNANIELPAMGERQQDYARAG